MEGSRLRDFTLQDEDTLPREADTAGADDAYNGTPHGLIYWANIPLGPAWRTSTAATRLRASTLRSSAESVEENKDWAGPTKKKPRKERKRVIISKPRVDASLANGLRPGELRKLFQKFFYDTWTPSAKQLPQDWPRPNYRGKVLDMAVPMPWIVKFRGHYWINPACSTTQINQAVLWRIYQGLEGESAIRKILQCQSVRSTTGQSLLADREYLVLTKEEAGARRELPEPTWDDILEMEPPGWQGVTREEAGLLIKKRAIGPRRGPRCNKQ